MKISTELQDYINNLNSQIQTLDQEIRNNEQKMQKAKDFIVTIINESLKEEYDNSTEELQFKVGNNSLRLNRKKFNDILAQAKITENDIREILDEELMR